MNKPMWPFPGSVDPNPPKRVLTPLPYYPHDPNPDNWQFPGRPDEPNQVTHPAAYRAWHRRYILGIEE